jgi:hypothetical protein
MFNKDDIYNYLGQKKDKSEFDTSKIDKAAKELRDLLKEIQKKSEEERKKNIKEVIKSVPSQGHCCTCINTNNNLICVNELIEKLKKGGIL